MVRLVAGDCVLILVDVQGAALSMVGSMPQDDLVANCAALVRVARALRLPVLVTEAPFPGDGVTRPAALAEALGVPDSLRHSGNDAWPSLRGIVASMDRRTLIIAGIATDVGVGLAALSACSEGLSVMVAIDASGTIDARGETAAWMRLSAAGVALASWTAIVAELAGSYEESPGSEVLSIVRARLWTTA